MVQNLTLLDLITAVSDFARSEAEVVATVVYMVNSGRVRLCGNFKGAHFDVRASRADRGVVEAALTSLLSGTSRATSPAVAA
jgi:hypothetical protein